MADPRIYGLIKPALDAHTLGIHAAADLLRDCGHTVIMANDDVASAMHHIRHDIPQTIVIDWIQANGIERLGVSYRLDQADAVSMLGCLIEALKKRRLLFFQNGPVDRLFFGGLPAACAAVEQTFGGLVQTFCGGESARETLTQMGVSGDQVPPDLEKGSRYDEMRHAFGKHIIDTESYKTFNAPDRSRYAAYGTKRDSVTLRLDAGDQTVPLTRAHVGPYESGLSRIEAVRRFLDWTRFLARAGLLDILSIGTSQLTQSCFGENWEDRNNGGGVPLNSAAELGMVRDAAAPMLVRTYAGTKNIAALARIYEETLNICWHALSLWWFNQLDQRGEYDVYTNLKQHLDTIRYAAATGKPFEANVSHHFAFRGADDVTYVVSAYLAAKLAKRLGIRTFVLQNMLNTPRTTWGVQDLAKSRALLTLVRSLADNRFRVLLQPRAGLDLFKPDLNEAKIQLAAVTALMDDIEAGVDTSPDIIHVVSYSEALFLATPDIINESIQITQHTLKAYRRARRLGRIPDMTANADVRQRSDELLFAARAVIAALEAGIPDLYTAEGLYVAMAAGFLPVPFLWAKTEEFWHARNWQTKSVSGSVRIIDETGHKMNPDRVIAIAEANLDEARRRLHQRMRT